ncbi:23S rRNA (pseudouridine(1915)-N(3))-methyltransferase RlmH [Levilactobacillus humaensis]|uniref:23S rRNA (pseudouridine(1915)-N(3))-methyltransferase RlmH n=1 Tax=Levilactobacillus humaensis TaxID=2950375 RepID=UPI0035A24E75
MAPKGELILNKVKRLLNTFMSWPSWAGRGIEGVLSESGCLWIFRLSLGTLPYQLMWLMLMERVYRAFVIDEGYPHCK